MTSPARPPKPWASHSDRWPFRPKPQPDELLSSYLCRIAAGMQLKPITMLTVMFGSDRTFLGQDIDNFAPEHVVTAISQGVGMEREAVEATTLRSFEGWLVESYSVKGRKTWILPTVAKSNHRRRHGLQFCPACLASDRRPYLRRTWRLAYATTCTAHGCDLLDGCPACGAVLHPHRSPSIRHCHACGTSLAGAATPADLNLVEWQRSLEEVLATGATSLNGDIVWSPAFFAIVRQIGALLVNGPRAEPLRAATTSALGGDPSAFAKSLRRQPIEYLDIDARRRLFDLVRRLMEDWPARFVTACREAGVFRSHVVKDMDVVPFAFERVLREHLDATPYQATDGEVAAAADWLRRTEGVATYKALKALCGESRVALYKHMDYVRRPSTPSRLSRLPAIRGAVTSADLTVKTGPRVCPVAGGQAPNNRDGTSPA